MTAEEKLFRSIGNNIADAGPSQMFGKPCFKINGKAFSCFYENEMVFKLAADIRDEALSLDGSQNFDPSKKNRPMKEWIQVPFHYAALWEKFALSAASYVNT